MVSRSLSIYSSPSHNSFFFLNVLTNVILCAIWYHLYNLKNVKNTHGKSETPPWMFFTLFTLYKWYQIAQCTTNTYYFRKLFDNYVTIGDFNMEPNNTTLKHFLDSNGLVKYQTCFKGKGSLIDGFLADRKYPLKDTSTFETDLVIIIIIIIIIIIWSGQC